MRDYHSSLVNAQLTSKLEKNRKYPLSEVLSYDKLSNTHKAFSLAISTDIEPTSYNAASRVKEWQEAMQVELHALEKNQTWDVVTLPH